MCVSLVGTMTTGGSLLAPVSASTLVPDIPGLVASWATFPLQKKRYKGEKMVP